MTTWCRREWVDVQTAQQTLTSRTMEGTLIANRFPEEIYYCNLVDSKGIQTQPRNELKLVRNG